MINKHIFFDTKMTPMTFFVISFKVQGRLCKIISLFCVSTLSPHRSSSSLSHTLTTNQYHQRSKHGGCCGIQEEIWCMVVEIRVEEAQWWLFVSLSEKKDEVVVVRSTSVMVDGDEIEEACWWWDSVVAARRFGDNWMSSMRSEIDTVGRRWPLDNESDSGGELGCERDLQRREIKRALQKKKKHEWEG